MNVKKEKMLRHKWKTNEKTVGLNSKCSWPSTRDSGETTLEKVQYCAGCAFVTWDLRLTRFSTSVSRCLHFHTKSTSFVTGRSQKHVAIQCLGSERTSIAFQIFNITGSSFIRFVRFVLRIVSSAGWRPSPCTITRTRIPHQQHSGRYTKPIRTESDGIL